MIEAATQLNKKGCCFDCINKPLKSNYYGIRTFANDLH